MLDADDWLCHVSTTGRLHNTSVWQASWYSHLPHGGPNTGRKYQDILSVCLILCFRHCFRLFHSGLSTFPSVLGFISTRLYLTSDGQAVTASLHESAVWLNEPNLTQLLCINHHGESVIPSGAWTSDLWKSSTLPLKHKKRRNATKPGFQRFNQVLMWQE